MKHLEQPMTNAYRNTNEEMMNDMDNTMSISGFQWRNPRESEVNEVELLIFLDPEDVEMNTADAENVENQLLDLEVEADADAGAAEHVLADTDAPMHKIEES